MGSGAQSRATYTQPGEEVLGVQQNSVEEVFLELNFSDVFTKPSGQAEGVPVKVDGKRAGEHGAFWGW